MTETPPLKQIIEGAILAADAPLSIESMLQLFTEDLQPARQELQEALAEIGADCEGRGFELKQVASGYRFQVRSELGSWVGRLWEEKPPRYTRALLETLALIAYKQPLTRGDIEEIRGVSVSTNIIRSLLEREWIRVVGHRDVPGRPAIYATTRIFLDYFDLKSLDELPTLSEIKDLDQVNPELDLEMDLIVPRSLSMSEDTPAEGDALDDEDVSLDEVTDRVNEIQSNIKNLFRNPEELSEEASQEDQDDQDDLDSEASAESSDAGEPDVEPAGSDQPPVNPNP